MSMRWAFLAILLSVAGSFAAETGGSAFVRSNNFERFVDQIWQESADYYLLGYSPPVDDQKVHRIEVGVKRPAVAVRFRRARG